MPEGLVCLKTVYKMIPLFLGEVKRAVKMKGIAQISALLFQIPVFQFHPTEDKLRPAEIELDFHQ